MFLDVAAESTNVGVDSSVSWASAAVTPGNNTDKLAVGNKWATRVTLASVFASLWDTSADHPVGDGAGSVLVIAILAADNLDGDRLKLVGNVATFVEGAPAGADNIGSSSWVATVRRQTNRLGSGAKFDFSGEFQNGDIVIDIPAAVLWVLVDLGDLDLLARFVEVADAGDEAEGRGRGTVSAVSGGHGPFAADDGSTTDVAAVRLQGQLVREVLDVGVITSNNPAIKAGADSYN